MIRLEQGSESPTCLACFPLIAPLAGLCCWLCWLWPWHPCCCCCCRSAPSIARIEAVFEDRRGCCHVALRYFWRWGQIHKDGDLHHALRPRWGPAGGDAMHK